MAAAAGDGKEGKQPTVTYFNIRGRGECIRLALSDLVEAGKWTNETVEFPEWGSKMKPEGIKAGRFPFGQIPAYEDDEVSGLVQMGAILRHIGRRFEAYGDGNVEAAQVDMVLDAVEDTRRSYGTLVYTDRLDAAKLAEFAAKIEAGFLTQVEAFMADRSGSEGKFLATKARPSIADYVALDMLQLIVRILPEALKEHTGLSTWVAGMEARAGIKAYLESKPECRETPNGVSLG